MSDHRSTTRLLLGGALLLGAMACTPPARDLRLDTGDRHWSGGDVFRLADDACEGPVTESEGAASVAVSNQYLQTTVVVVDVAPDCSTSNPETLPPGQDLHRQVQVPAVIRIQLEDERILSTWGVFYPLGEGSIVVQP